MIISLNKLNALKFLRCEHLNSLSIELLLKTFDFQTFNFYSHSMVDGGFELIS